MQEVKKWVNVKFVRIEEKKKNEGGELKEIELQEGSMPIL